PPLRRRHPPLLHAPPRPPLLTPIRCSPIQDLARSASDGSDARATQFGVGGRRGGPLRGPCSQGCPEVPLTKMIVEGEGYRAAEGTAPPPTNPGLLDRDGLDLPEVRQAGESLEHAVLDERVHCLGARDL